MTVYEFTASALGAQDAIGGGGRYDNLIEEMGGDKAGAVPTAQLRSLSQVLGRRLSPHAKVETRIVRVGLELRFGEIEWASQI